MKERFILSFILGGALMALTSMRFAVQPLAWIAYTPLLAPLFVEGGKKRLWWLFAVLLIFMHLTVAKIVVAPISYFMVPLFAIPMTFGAFLTIVLATTAYRNLGIRWGIYLLPAIIVTFEWIQYTYSDQSAWGAMALTQTQNLSLMQMGSLFGIAGLSYLVALGSSLFAGVLVEGIKRLRWDIIGFVIVFAAAHLYGEVRLAHDAPGTMMRVAAVSSPFSAEETMAVINDSRLAREKDALLFSRSLKAADLGAKIVVWNEAATIIGKNEEPAFLEKGKSLAKLRQVDLVMAYGVLVSRNPIKFENKYVWIRSDGSVADEYWKQHPVPGEGSIRGNKAAQAVTFPEGKVSGAICYDYDFPEIALSNVRAGAGLAVIPSSDWRGIDPLHSDMARFMGVATGMSIVRSVRSATSFASDPYGRIKASMRFYESKEGVMVADVTAVAVPTVYSKTGDIFPLITAAFSVFAVFGLLIHRWKNKRQREG